MKLQVWHDDLAVRGGRYEVSSLRFFLTSDTAKSLPTSFALEISARVLGAQVGAVTVNPMKNGKFSMPLLAKIGGTVEGRIDDWQAYDRNGKAVDGRKDPKWKTADAVGFTITGVADVTVSAKAISSIIPVIGWAAKIALQLLGNKVKISVAHHRVITHLPHGAH
jgi:hypothetical protein